MCMKEQSVVWQFLLRLMARKPSATNAKTPLALQMPLKVIGVSLSEPHHVRSTVKSVFLLACLLT